MRPETQEALRKIAYVRSKPKPKKRLRFADSDLDFTGVEDRRDWFNPEHRTPWGQAISDYMNTTGGGILWDGATTLGRKLRRFR